MIDIKKKKCLYEGCDINPSFNYKNEIKGLYCYEHKLENMINVIIRRCIFDSCETTASFNHEDEITPKYCARHKLGDMVNINYKKNRLNQ